MHALRGVGGCFDGPQILCLWYQCRMPRFVGWIAFLELKLHVEQISNLNLELDKVAERSRIAAAFDWDELVIFDGKCA